MCEQLSHNREETRKNEELPIHRGNKAIRREHYKIRTPEDVQAELEGKHVSQTIHHTVPTHLPCTPGRGRGRKRVLRMHFWYLFC